MTESDSLTEDQAYWLKALLETRPRSRAKVHVRDFRMPDEVSGALVSRGLVRVARGVLEITLDGIREVARIPFG